mgnify:CR=1 FL=1
MSGMFITFEGTDGSGKTSVIKAIVKELEKNGKTEYVLTREPGGNRISEAIRNVILDERFEDSISLKRSIRRFQPASWFYATDSLTAQLFIKEQGVPSALIG